MTKIYTTCIIGFVSWCAVAQAREINIWSNEGLWQLHYMIERAERRKHFEQNMKRSLIEFERFVSFEECLLEPPPEI